MVNGDGMGHASRVVFGRGICPGHCSLFATENAPKCTILRVKTKNPPRGVVVSSLYYGFNYKYHPACEGNMHETW